MRERHPEVAREFVMRLEAGVETQYLGGAATALLEAVFVTIVLHLGRESGIPGSDQRPSPRSSEDPPECSHNSSFGELGTVGRPMYNTLGEKMVDLGAEVWNPEGIKILGTPVGSWHFVRQKVTERVDEERRLWEAIPHVPDLQCAWQILLQCAGPRCHHMLRTLPPTQSREYAEEHDAGMQRTMEVLLGGLPGDDQAKDAGVKLATLPMRLGGLGLRSAQRVAPDAFWASWADALHMIHERLPAVARTITHKLNNEVEGDGCLGELKSATALLDHHGLRWKTRVGAVADGSATSRQRTLSSQVSGHTDGNTTSPLLLSTSSGGRWC